MMKMIITLSLFIAFTFSQPPGVSDRDHENARMMKKWKLIEYLDLNEEQSEKFFVMVNAFQKEMKTIHKKKKKLREDIHEMLEEDKLNDNKVDRTIDNFFNNESEIQELRRKHHKKIDEVLTAEQTIKYLIFDHKFKKRIKDQLLEGRKHRGDGPPH